MALFQCVAQLIVEVGHANVQLCSNALAPLGVQRILRFFLKRSPMTDSTADSAMLVEIGSPGRCRVP